MDWTEYAACNAADPELFYANENKKNYGGGKWRAAPEAQEARYICNTLCSVQKECLEYALEIKEPHGIYGGLDSRERWMILKGASSSVG